MTDYIFPDRKLFPINSPEDILKAIECYHLFKDEISYSDFSNKLVRLAQRKGKDFVAVLPNKVKKLMGVKRENKPEVNKEYNSVVKKRKSRFIRNDDEDY